MEGSLQSSLQNMGLHSSYRVLSKMHSSCHHRLVWLHLANPGTRKPLMKLAHITSSRLWNSGGDTQCLSGLVVDKSSPPQALRESPLICRSLLAVLKTSWGNFGTSCRTETITQLSPNYVTDLSSIPEKVVIFSHNHEVEPLKFCYGCAVTLAYGPISST